MTLSLQNDGSILQVANHPLHLTAGISTALVTVVWLSLLYPKSTLNRLTFPILKINQYIRESENI